VEGDMGRSPSAQLLCFSVFFFCFVIISEGFLALFFTDSLDLYFRAGFFNFAGRFLNI
jgi:hypothetical protein